MPLYILELAHGKYFVGSTPRLEPTVRAHKDGVASQWTRLHPIKCVLSTFPEQSPFFEDMIVKTLMSRHGIHNVRGGSYADAYLSDTQAQLLQHELRETISRCCNCGGMHAAASCPRAPDMGPWLVAQGRHAIRYALACLWW